MHSDYKLPRVEPRAERFIRDVSQLQVDLQGVYFTDEERDRIMREIAQIIGVIRMHSYNYADYYLCRAGHPL